MADLIMRNSKKLPVVINWGVRNVFLAQLEFLGNGTLVFKLEIKRSGMITEKLVFGNSHIEDGKFINHPQDRSTSFDNGFHISLHPPTKTKRGVMHLRKHYPGKILERREIDWFPVKKPFNLLRAYTPTMSDLVESKRKITVSITLEAKYEGPLELLLDIFPRDTNESEQNNLAAVIWGYCPSYLVRLSISKASNSTPSTIYWPDDDILEL